MFEIARRNHNNSVSNYSPFREMEELERNFFADPLGHFFRSSDLAEFKTDIQDKGDYYLLEADLPGFQKEDIHLDLNGDVLTINAERKSQHKEEKGRYIRCERSYGQYARQFDMSAVDTQGIKAKYDNGVLTLTLPKKKCDKHDCRKIEIG